MEILHLIGRIILGGFFAYSGFNHFVGLSGSSQYARSKGVPAPKLAVLGTGLMLILGGASVILGLWPNIGLWMIIAFLVPTSFIMHDFWAVPEDQKQMQMINFTKNMALAGAALMMLVTAPEAWPYTLSG
jgi:uncharacterized membrane protein YphA (DoxX/SURF4 family)